jgi:hypothetical protein
MLKLQELNQNFHLQKNHVHFTLHNFLVPYARTFEKFNNKLAPFLLKLHNYTFTTSCLKSLCILAWNLVIIFLFYHAHTKFKPSCFHTHKYHVLGLFSLTQILWGLNNLSHIGKKSLLLVLSRTWTCITAKEGELERRGQN